MKQPLKGKTLVLFGIMLALAVALAFLMQGDTTEPEYVVRINGEAVYLPEFYVYLSEQRVAFEDLGGSAIWETNFDGESAENVAKQRALASLTRVKISAAQARARGIEVTESDWADIENRAQRFYNRVGGGFMQSTGVSMDDIVFIMTEIILHYRIFEELTQNYRINENDFLQYFRQYKEAHGIENPEATLENRIRAMYSQERRLQIFEAEYQRWMDDIIMHINHPVWDTISVFDF